MIKAIGRLLFGFRGRISREKWWVAVAVVVGLNVWHTHEILEMKKQVRLHAKTFKAHQIVKAIVYVARGGTEYHRENCKRLALELGRKEANRVCFEIELSEAKKKYDRCEVCKPATERRDRIVEQTLRRMEEEEDEFDRKLEAALRRLRWGRPSPPSARAILKLCHLARQQMIETLISKQTKE